MLNENNQKRQKRVNEKNRKQKTRATSRKHNKYDRYYSPTSIITWNVNGLSAPIKKDRLSEVVKKHDPVHVVYKKPNLNIKIHID